MFDKVDRFLKDVTNLVMFLLSILFIVVLGYLDYLVAQRISFSVFYAVPVACSAWYINRKSGLFMSFLAAVTWFIADITVKQQYAHLLIPIWNSMVRLAFFSVIAVLLSIIKDKLDMEENLADTDYLTGLKNNRAFYEHVNAESTRSKRYNRPFTIAYIDLDNFKHLNDTKGHEAGDEALKTVAETIKRNVRHFDITSRLGGDEFAVLFPETGYSAAESIIKKVQPLLTSTMQDNITFSIGVITFVTPMASVREMIKATDDLMYEIKKKGKNNIIHKQWG